MEAFRSSATAPLLARVRVRVDGVRRSIYLGPWESAEASERYARLEAAWAANGHALPEHALELAGGPALRDDGGPTVQEVLLLYLDEVAKPHLSKSEHGNCRVAGQKAIDFYGSRPVAAFGIDELRVVRDAFVADGLARRTVNAYVARIRRAFDWAVSEGKIGGDLPDLHRLKPLKAGRTTAPEPGHRVAADWKQIHAVCEQLPSPVRGIVLAAAWTGARVGEVVQMRTRDVDMSGKVWHFTPPQHKTKHRGKQRVIVIGPTGQRALREFVQLDPDRYWFRPIDSDLEHRAERRARRTTPLWPSHERRNQEKRKADPQTKPGETFDKDTVGRCLRRACAAAGVHVTMHQIRYAAIGRVLESEGREAAMLIAGHNSELVNRIYTEAAEQRMRDELAAKLG